jgi:hypothetical protein
MKTAIAHLKSISSYSQSRFHNTPSLDKEAPDAKEERTWRERCHTLADGRIFIPPMQFKKAIEGAAKMLRMRIPGKGKSEYGKHFLAGVLVTEGLPLPITKDTVVGEWLHMNSDGKKNSGSRVLRCFPCIPEWAGKVTYYILDETIPEDVFETHLRESGNFVGIGRFRPAVGGFYGRFEVKKVEWK